MQTLVYPSGIKNSTRVKFGYISDILNIFLYSILSSVASINI